ncbi:MAG: hypothetical protein D6820_04695, partial [Lentisphaerae bacterium]
MEAIRLYAMVEEQFPLLSIWFFYLGACVGSFLNVVIWRVPQRLSLIFVRSHCPSCNARIRIWENIPIFAWLFLLGRCRHCRAKIPPRYLLMEILTGFVFFVIWFQAWQRYFAYCNHASAEIWPVPLAVNYLVLLSFLIVLSGIDLDYRIVPDRVIVTGVFLALILAIAYPSTHELLTAPGKLQHLRHKPILYLAIQLLGPLKPFFLNSARRLAMLDWALGVLWGGGLIWGLGELGKLVRGKKRFRFEEAVALECNAIGYTNEEGEWISWEDTFIRASDKLTIRGTLTLLELTPPEDNPNLVVEHPLLSQIPLEGEFILTRDGLYLSYDFCIPFELLNKATFFTHDYTIPLEPLGLGDATLMALIGAYLGPGPILPVLVLASFMGSVVGLLKMLFSRAKLHSGLPFVPFLTIATFMYIQKKKKIWHWLLL